MGKKAPKPLSHAEIWDDSALLQTWDDALAEYKAYHSIAARGENVEDVLNATEKSEVKSSPNGNQAKLLDDMLEEVDQEMEEGELDETFEEETSKDEHSDQHGANIPSTGIDSKTSLPSAGYAAPSAITNGMNDDALKNLMMSWYYAGYYTGLYEGQQRASGSKES